ncbi:hypothetical protein Cgig2_033992 [Carnegiea gigantea]|uniref:Uncharacterized protein n=1 Tax=Carnegiea gigantea TaxID=171969 RepID=A0A9Q1GPM3_9CARY|nr:hypothetical protein Cgig2_033992 [Carnegiea gigantea]
MLKYARFLIETNLEGPFSEYIEFINDNEVLVRQQVKYEWLPIKCDHCHMFAHVGEDPTRKEWRPVQRKKDPATVQVEQASTQVDTEGFITEDLEQIVMNMTDLWSVIGVFNVVLTPEDTIGGNEITDYEVRDFADCAELCGLQEMRSTGAYFSRTNRTIRSRIDRAFTNLL